MPLLVEFWRKTPVETERSPLIFLHECYGNTSKINIIPGLLVLDLTILWASATASNEL